VCTPTSGANQYQVQGATPPLSWCRLSTVQKANAIAVVDGGCIAELGAHADLLANNGKYAQLIRQQAI
jgi:ATP-binding cassette subfamily B protein